MSDEELGGGQQRGAGALRGMRSEEDWQRLVVEFKASGLSARAFGQLRGVAPNTLLRRAGRILRGQQLPGQPQGATKPFLAVPLKREARATPSATGMRIEHPGGLTVWLDAAQAERVMGAVLGLLAGGARA